MENRLLADSVGRRIIRLAFGHLIILLMMSGLSLAATSNAQEILDKKLTLDVRNESLKEVLRKIEGKVGVKFAYSKDAVRTVEDITLKVVDRKLSEVLDELLNPRQIQYHVIGEQIILNQRPDEKAALEGNETPVEAESLDESISGIVRDEAGASIPGVNVLLKGTSIGTVTDVDGRYALSVPDLNGTLIFSYIGYTSIEEPINGRTSIDIALAQDVTNLDEVVVVGYGVQKKVSMTSAVSEIGGDELVRRPVTSIQQALQGKLPGVTILDRGGSPGSPNAHIVVRGVNKPYQPVGLGGVANSVIGDNAPLAIVDGIEQPFQNINPNDIASISVLKDASSSAIYGSRAANGVIMITTKRATPGRVRVTYDGFYAVHNSISKPKHMDIESYLRLQNAAFENVGRPPKYTESELQEYVSGSVTDPLQYPLPFDWYNVMLEPAPQVNHALSVSGGSENFRARMSLRSQDQDGVIPNTESKLTEVRVNTDFQISPKISVTTDLDYRFQNNLEPNNINEIFRQFMQNSIWAVPQYPDGTYGGGTQGNNPKLLAEKGGTSREKSNYLLGNIQGKWQIIEGLTFTTQLAIRSTDLTGKTFVNTWQTKDGDVVKRSNLINRLTEKRNNNREITLNHLLNYDATFKDHSVKVLGGYSQIEHDNSELSAYRQGFYNNDVRSISQGTNDPTKDNDGSDYEWGLRSYFGRFNYSFKDKYLFEANARYDGSSRFTDANRYSFFPSFSVGWRISEEGFWSGLEGVVSDLKVRGSWGETGNQAVPLYSYFPRLDLVTYNFSGSTVAGYVQRQLADPNLTWETTTQTDIGLDAELLSGRISFTMDYYKKVTSGILLTLPVPGTLGLEPGAQNAGTVENEGWEFMVGSANRIGDFVLNANANLSINNNEVVNLAGTGPYIYGNDIDPRYITGEGYPINAFWGYKTGGLFQTDAEAAAYPEFMRPARAGDVKILDLNNDGQISPDDMTYLSNSFPTYTFGAGVNLAYKAFSLNMVLQGAADAGMRVARALGEAGNYEGFTPDIYTDNYWTPERPDARFARPTKQDLRNQASTDRMILDASYVRVKNIQLAYQLPSALTRKVFIENASVYVSGTNLLTFSELNEWNLDPESASGWQNYYPQTSVYTLGVNLQL
jgi:TonB-linked SusC/RagA family outer membrane protein